MFSLFVFMESLLIICLLLVSINDIKKRKIPNSLVVAIYLIGILNIISGRVSYADSIAGLSILPVIILSVSKICNFKVGMGDIKLISAIGFCLGLLSQMFVVSIGMSVSLIYILIKRKKTIALGPFIGLGTFITLIMSGNIVK